MGLAGARAESTGARRREHMGQGEEEQCCWEIGDEQLSLGIIFVVAVVNGCGILLPITFCF